MKSGVTNEDEKYLQQILFPAINKARGDIIARSKKNDLKQKDEILRKLHSYMTLVHEKLEQPNHPTILLSELIKKVHIMHSGMMFMTHLIRKT